MIKLMIIGRRRHGMTVAEHRQHIKERHGALVLDYIAQDPMHAPRRYVQNAVFEGTFRHASVAGDPFSLNRDFVTQVWFEDGAAAARSRQQPFYLEHLREDEGRFVDESSIVVLPVHERVLAGRGAAVPACCKLFLFLGRAVGVEAEPFRAAWAERASSLWSRTLRSGHALRHVQNDVLTRPDELALVDGIDEFWLTDDASVMTFASTLQETLVEPLVDDGVVRANSSFVLMAKECVLHAGTV